MVVLPIEHGAAGESEPGVVSARCRIGSR
jgi:hypothetical protein